MKIRRPDLGEFTPVRVPLTVSAVDALALQPAELADYVRDHVGGATPCPP
ncbi:hypothetical protein [Streptomyces sp. NBC_01716]|nr:hypothetical protein [Streptomyces sp. NBC_01716]